MEGHRPGTNTAERLGNGSLHDLAVLPIGGEVLEGEVELLGLQVLAGLVLHRELGVADDVDRDVLGTRAVLRRLDVVRQGLEIGGAWVDSADGATRVAIV